VPPLCVNCRADRAVIGGYGRFLCAACEQLVQPFSEKVPRCTLCGAPNTGALTTCAECAGVVRPWFRGVSVFPYHGPCGELLRQFKYAGRTELMSFFGAALADAWKKHGLNARPQAIVPIPLHWKRMVIRGFNQSELLATELARHLHLPVMKALCRNSATAHQARLDAADRLKNLKGVFCVRQPEAWRNRRLLLLDDVFTTGATLTAATLELLAAGAAEVSVITVARA